MSTLTDLRSEINQIKERNRRVEADKAWETSWTRRILVALLTYFVIVVLFHFAGVANPLFNSVIPALAFVLSTSSLPFLKGFWIKYFYRKDK
jgi:uncharacterized membrane-anchored protein